MEKVSFRHSRQSFDRYASAIASVIEEYPKPVVIDPGILSLETVSCRLRDALFACVKYEYRTAKVEPLVLKNFLDNLTVAIRDGKVVAGHRDFVKTFTPVEVVSSNVAVEPVPQVTTFNGKVIVACATLVQAKVLKAVAFHNVPIESAKLLCEPFDVEFVVRPDHFIMI